MRVKLRRRESGIGLIEVLAGLAVLSIGALLLSDLSGKRAVLTTDIQNEMDMASIPITLFRFMQNEDMCKQFWQNAIPSPPGLTTGPLNVEEISWTPFGATSPFVFWNQDDPAPSSPYFGKARLHSLQITEKITEVDTNNNIYNVEMRFGMPLPSPIQKKVDFFLYTEHNTTTTTTLEKCYIRTADGGGSSTSPTQGSVCATLFAGTLLNGVCQVPSLDIRAPAPVAAPNTPSAGNLVVAGKVRLKANKVLLTGGAPANACTETTNYTERDAAGNLLYPGCKPKDHPVTPVRFKWDQCEDISIFSTVSINSRSEQGFLCPPRKFAIGFSLNTTVKSSFIFNRHIVTINNEPRFFVFDRPHRETISTFQLWSWFGTDPMFPPHQAPALPAINFMNTDPFRQRLVPYQNYVAPSGVNPAINPFFTGIKQNQITRIRCCEKVRL